jgi:hypothetical protein
MATLYTATVTGEIWKPVHRDAAARAGVTPPNVREIPREEYQAAMRQADRGLAG